VFPVAPGLTVKSITWYAQQEAAGLTHSIRAVQPGVAAPHLAG
jgi:hypothetical protein